MVDRVRELSCISSVTQELSNCFHRQDHPTKEVPERPSGRIRRANLLKRAARASVPSSLRRGKRFIPPSPIQRPAPASFPILLPRLSFGEALPDADELFCSAGGSSSLTALPSGQHDRSLDVPDQQVQVTEHQDEDVLQQPVEDARVDASPPGSSTQPSPRQTPATAFLETCIMDMMSNTERRPGRGRRSRRIFEEGRTGPIPLLTKRLHDGYSPLPPSRQRAGNTAIPTVSPSSPDPEQPEARGRSRRGFDERRSQPRPLPTESLQGGYSAFPPPKQRTGDAATPAVSPSNSEPEQSEQPEAKTRLDSADLPVSETHQVSTLEPLGEELCRDSGAYVPGQPAPKVELLDWDKATAAPVDRPESHGTSTTAIKDADPSVFDQLNIPTPPAVKSPSPSSPLPTSGIHSQPESQTSPSERFPGSLRTSRAMRARPQPVNRPQQPQNPGTIDSSPSKGDVLPVVDGHGSSSRTLLDTSSSSPPCVPPRDPARERKD